MIARRRTVELFERFDDLRECRPELDRAQLARELGVADETLRRALSRHGRDTMAKSLATQPTHRMHCPCCACEHVRRHWGDPGRAPSDRGVQCAVH